MTLSYTAVRRAALVLLALPCLVFVLGMLRPLVAIPVALLLLLALFFAARPGESAHKAISLSPRTLLLLLLLSAFWCWQAGIGNLYYQSADYAARNAVFRDLITFRWPVLYPNKNSALVYYIGFWLPAALVGKCLLPFGENVAFLGGNLALYVWATISALVLFLLLAHLLGCKSERRLLLAVGVFVLFSGLDAIGTLCNTLFVGHPFPDHLEWWAFYFQFSSHTTALFWVFNQALPCFLATLLFLAEQRVRAWVLILSCTLCSAPFACVGLGALMAVRFLSLLLSAAKEGGARALWGELLTPHTLIPALTLLPLFFLYYKTNLAFAMTKLPSVRVWHVLLLLACVLALLLCLLGYRTLARRGCAPRPTRLFAVLLLLFLCTAPLVFSRAEPIYYAFLLLECGIYFALLYPDHYADSLYYGAMAVLVLCPLFVIGTSADFSMRVSLPAICVLCVFCIRSLLAFLEAHELRSLSTRRRLLGILLCVALCIGALTPLAEFLRGLVSVIREGDLLLINDAYGTMSGIFPNGIGSTDKNFIAWDYTKTFFFRYLAKGVG